MHRIVGLALALFLAGPQIVAATALSPSLRGSPAAMEQQNRVAREHGLSFYRTPRDIREAAARGDLVELHGDENYDVADFVTLPYLHPDAALFVERLAAQYRAACGQKLVVTSAVRPTNGQPPNAHRLSVHPAGMAVDLRVSDRQACRAWLEGAILNLERRGVLNGIREFHPPHYHVAIFPEPYRAYVETRLAAEEAAAAAVEVELEPDAAVPAAEIARAGVSAGFLAPAERTDEAAPSDRHTDLASVLALFLAIPVGLGLLVRHLRRSGSG